MATTSNSQFYFSNAFPLTEVEQRLGEAPSKRIDIFNPRGAAFIRSMQPGKKIQWSERNKLDVVAFKTFGSVSAWWMVLFFNGDQHPFEIESGRVFTIPSPQLANTVAQNRTSGRGSRVTI